MRSKQKIIKGTIMAKSILLCSFQAAILFERYPSAGVNKLLDE
jgi:hypothetical protein